MKIESCSVNKVSFELAKFFNVNVGDLLDGDRT